MKIIFTQTSAIGRKFCATQSLLLINLQRDISNIKRLRFSSGNEHDAKQPASQPGSGPASTQLEASSSTPRR